MSEILAALDSALAATGESFILRRVIGSGAAVSNIDVTCVGRIDATGVTDIAAGLKATDLKVIFSPTQINQAQWPGGSSPQQPPFEVDQRIPRENGADKALIRGVLRQIASVKPYVIAGELVRIEMRVSG